MRQRPASQRVDAWVGRAEESDNESSFVVAGLGEWWTPEAREGLPAAHWARVNEPAGVIREIRVAVAVGSTCWRQVFRNRIWGIVGKMPEALALEVARAAGRIAEGFLPLNWHRLPTPEAAVLSRLRTGGTEARRGTQDACVTAPRDPGTHTSRFRSTVRCASAFKRSFDAESHVDQRYPPRREQGGDC